MLPGPSPTSPGHPRASMGEMGAGVGERMRPLSKDQEDRGLRAKLPELFCSARKKRLLKRSDRPFPEKRP